MDQFIKVAGTKGKVGGYFCWLLPLNVNTAVISNSDILFIWTFAFCLQDESEPSPNGTLDDDVDLSSPDTPRKITGTYI